MASSSTPYHHFLSGLEKPSCEGIRLPSSFFDAHELYKTSELDFFHVYNYIKMSFAYGRPLDSAMIVTVGESGAGKSSTINALFNDPDLCPTSKFKSETKAVTIISKELCVTSAQPAIIGKLSLVDTPGTFDSDGDDARNFAIVKHFRNTDLALASYSRDVDSRRLRIMLKGARFNLRKTVYPNVVLFFIAAMSGRIDGSSTNLRKSLNALKMTNLVDCEYPNLIVVVTHAIRLGRTEDKFYGAATEMETIIREAVYNVLGMDDIHIVLIENNAEDELLTKDPNSEYYFLPNGELSHYNLLEAIQQRFNKRNDSGFEDLIGKLFVGWYATPNCPEKYTSAEITIMDGDPDSIELAEAATECDLLYIPPDRRNQKLTTKFGFVYLGHGFCPNTGNIKMTSLLSGNDFQTVKISSKNFLIPSGLTMIPDKATSVYTLNYDGTANSSTSWNSSLSLDVPLPWFNQLNMGVDLGHWKSISRSSRSTNMHCFVFEKRIASFQIDDPLTVYNCPSFQTQLDNLPDTYDAYEEIYEAFLNRWGTHFVSQQCIGGAIYVNFISSNTNLTEEWLWGVEAKLKMLFTSFGTTARSENAVEELRSLGVRNEQINIIGGESHPTVLTFNDLTREIIQEWNDSIYYAPANLVGNSRSFPYYQLLESGEKHRSLQRATVNYLLTRHCMEDHEPQTRDTISNQMVNEAIQSSQKESANCFPKDTLVYVNEKQTNAFVYKAIKNLDVGDNLKTIDLTWTPFAKPSLGQHSSSGFCTMLHNAPLKVINYLVLSFGNGKELVVSDDHLIFGFRKGHLIIVKAVEFSVGDFAVFSGPTVYELQYEVVECVSRSSRICVGAYAPLTYSGTFFANGFLVSSYANVDSFLLAQVSMLPLKLWSMSKAIMKPLCVFPTPVNLNSCEAFASCKTGDHDKIHTYAKSLMKFRSSLQKITRQISN